MWFKLIGIVSTSLIFISYGILWYRKGLSSKAQYDFKEDFKHSFLTPHSPYSSHFNLNDSKPRRIGPFMVILGGIGILVVGLIKII